MPTGEELDLLAASPIIVKMLGPTADYLGQGARDWTERGFKNLSRVFEKAERKLGDEELERPGGVPPRVLKEILEQGQFSDDELSAEYLGGVLASSRSEVSRDDRAASLSALVGRLSSYQLRSHYIFYALAQRALVGTEANLWFESDRQRVARFYLRFSDWSRAMDFSPAESVGGIVDHVLIGLVREELIGSAFAYGSPEDLNTFERHEYPEAGFAFMITPLGIELFVAVHGLRNPRQAFKAASDQFKIDADIILPAGVTPINALPPLAT